MTFKIGDKVKMRRDCSGMRAGDICELHNKHENGDIPENKLGLAAWNDEVDQSVGWGCSCEDDWELVESA